MDPLNASSPAFSTFVGLLFHALADGIALGAAAMSSQQLPGTTLGEAATSGLSFVIFFSLLIHKAPVAFSLTVLLISYAPAVATSTRAYYSQIRKSLLVFSLATPVGAIATWIVLKVLLLASWSDSMDESAEEDGNIEEVVGGNMRGRLEFWSKSFLK
jgi:zinc transporter 9